MSDVQEGRPVRLRIQPLADGTTEVDIKLLPDGKTLIHWLRENDDGLVVIQGHPRLREVMGRKSEGRYTLACRPLQNTVTSQKRGSVRFLCMTSNDVAAVTCPGCLATSEAKAALAVPANEGAAQLQMDTLKSIGV